MMIKRKLKIIFYLCATLVAISSIAVIYSLRHMERKHEERKDIHAVTRGIFDLNLLADDSTAPGAAFHGRAGIQLIEC